MTRPRTKKPLPKPVKALALACKQLIADARLMMTHGIDSSRSERHLRHAAQLANTVLRGYKVTKIKGRKG